VLLLNTAAAIALLGLVLWCTNQLSYRILKNRVLGERTWDYNICCGTTDAGGINADIVQHATVPNFELVRDVTALPHRDQAFDQVICSHTLEHVDNPMAMFRELQRVGKSVTILVPPLWDLGAAFNPAEHRVIFLTLRTRHDNHLPPYIAYAPARWLQDVVVGQRIDADATAKGATAGRPFALRGFFHALTPLAWGLAASVLLQGEKVGLLFFAAATIVWRLSRRQVPVLR